MSSWWEKKVLEAGFPVRNTNLLLVQDLRNEDDNFHVVRIFDKTSFEEIGWFNYNQQHSKDLPFSLPYKTVYLIYVELKEGLRGHGLGALIVPAIESFFHSKGKQEIWILSKKPRVPFWTRMGFRGNEVIDGCLFMKKLIRT